MLHRMDPRLGDDVLLWAYPLRSVLLSKMLIMEDVSVQRIHIHLCPLCSILPWIWSVCFEKEWEGVLLILTQGQRARLKPCPANQDTHLPFALEFQPAPSEAIIMLLQLWAKCFSKPPWTCSSDNYRTHSWKWPSCPHREKLHPPPTELPSAPPHHFLPGTDAPQNGFFKLGSHIFWFLKGQTIHSFKYLFPLKCKHQKRHWGHFLLSFHVSLLPRKFQWSTGYLLCTQSKIHTDKADPTAGSAVGRRGL